MQLNLPTNFSDPWRLTVVHAGIAGLEQIGHGQSARYQAQYGNRRAAGKPPNFARHMRLVAVARMRGQMGQGSGGTGSPRLMQKALKAEDRLKLPGAVPSRDHETPLKLPAAHSEPFAQLIDLSVGISRHPPDGRSDCGVDRTSVCHVPNENGFHGLNLRRKGGFVSNLQELCTCGAVPYVTKNYGSVKQFRCGHAQEARSKPGMAARPEDRCAGRKMGIEWLSPRADDHRQSIGEDDVDATVGEDPLCEGGRRTYGLRPEAHEEFREGRGGGNSR
jgi:hypothetical protein